MSHTPGKWEVMDMRPMGWNDLAIVADGPEEVCRITNNNESDARLIAKAPEMLELLKAIPFTVAQYEVHKRAQELIKEIEG